MGGGGSGWLGKWEGGGAGGWVSGRGERVVG